MKFKCISSNAGGCSYVVVEDVSRKDFLLLMDAVANCFGLEPNLTSIPEADIVTINFPNGKIYAKYDLDYGVEIDSATLSVDQQIKLESILASR